jgi:hypothetical protein
MSHLSRKSDSEYHSTLQLCFAKSRLILFGDRGSDKGRLEAPLLALFSIMEIIG